MLMVRTFQHNTLSSFVANRSSNDKGSILSVVSAGSAKYTAVQYGGGCIGLTRVPHVLVSHCNSDTDSALELCLVMMTMPSHAGQVKLRGLAHEHQCVLWH
eukprot:6488051-Amphidinium_carterae.1